MCAEAREHRAPPYTRTGPSMFVHGPNVVFDTPEEAKLQLDRAGLDDIAGCFYSHWHPDHVMGRRVWETRNADFRTWPREAKRNRTTDVYLPEQVAADFRTYLGGWDHLTFMEARGWIRVHVLADGDVVELGGTTIRPFRVAEDYVYAFELAGGSKRLLVAPDELNGWEPPEEVRGADVAVIPMGICERDPLTGERRIHPEHPVLTFEATHEETLRIVDALDAGLTVLSHVEEMDGLTYDDLRELEGRYRAEGRRVAFAYDGMTVEV